MKMVIIGARGMLGQALAEVFADLGPTLWDREEIDIADSKKTRGVILGEKPNIIINAAAMTDVDACEEKPEQAFLINGEAAGNLAKLADELGATLVHYSTSYVFDGKKRDGYKESDKPEPVSVYGQSKLAGERGAAAAKKHYILRLDRLFGKPGLGKKSFVDKIQEAALVQRQLKIVDEEEGCPTYAPDLAGRTKYILQNSPPFGIYHATNTGSCTWYSFARQIFKIAGIEAELLPVTGDDFARKAKRPKYSILLNTKLPPMRSWQDALKEYLTDNT
jgi:dTDP-4-dehydrorhamnose reductase